MNKDNDTHAGYHNNIIINIILSPPHIWHDSQNVRCMVTDIGYYEYMEVVRHVVVNDMSCWTIVEHVYGIITLIINSSFHKLFNCTTFHPSRASSGTKMIYTIRNIDETHIVIGYYVVCSHEVMSLKQ